MSLKELSTVETVIAGALSGLVELLVMFPLDVVKTRAQLVQEGNKQPLGVIKSFRSIVEEGGVRRLYRGILAPAMQEPIKRSLKFTSNSIYSKYLPENNFQSRFAAGALAGMTECIGIAPFEVVKVRMQAANRITAYRSVPHCVGEILRQEGVVGFATGLESALWRNGSWNGTYFSLIWLTKKKMGEADIHVTKSVNFLAGFIGGTLATVANNPFDVVASRMRNVIPGESSPLRWSLQSLVHITSREGLGALYKGFLPKVLRLGPGGGIMIVAFDFAKDVMISRK